MQSKIQQTDLSSEILWKRFIEGDMQSFRYIYTRYYQNLHSFGLIHINSHVSSKLESFQK